MNQPAAYIAALASARECPENVVYSLAWYGCRLAGIPTSELQVAQRQQWAFKTYADNIRMGEIGEPLRHVEAEPIPEFEPVKEPSPQVVPAEPVPA